MSQKSFSRLEQGDNNDVKTEKTSDCKTRQRHRSRSGEQPQVQLFPPRRRAADGKYSRTTKTLLTGALLALGLCALVLILLSARSIGDLIIYSPHSELRRRLAEASSDDTVPTLHLDERYAFDGTHSDFAQQFYRRYLAGDETEAITDTSGLEEVVNYVKDEFGFKFSELPAMLQQAVVWDMGYVAAAALGYVKVYTKCGVRMSELQITRSAYRSAGCIEQRCSSPNGELFYQSLYCNGYQMGNVSLCAATNGVTPVHGSMWADGGTDDMVPVSEMQRHEWTDAGINYTIMAIHLSGDPNRYGRCVMPAMTVPCVAYDASTANGSNWCSPKHGDIVPQWLELLKTGSVDATETSGWQKAALPVTITSSMLLLLALIAVFVLWRKTREKLRETEDTLEQKRAILGGRRSDEFSMMDEIDFILDTSIIENNANLQTWEAWRPPTLKPKQVNKQSALDRSSEDYDTILLRGSFEGKIDVDGLYLHEASCNQVLHSTVLRMSESWPLPASIRSLSVDQQQKRFWMNFTACWNMTRRARPRAANRYEQSGISEFSDCVMAGAGYDVDFAALGLAPERFEAFKTVFSSLDKVHTGAISTRQLDALCFQLGETFDEEELAVAAASLADPQTGLIHFATFLSWWVSE
ncbi:hypothetical protein PF006_g2617 [Phytophthora fragariae]|uniref:EF-hand domain-containing protein n=3 Tax=Phytophthora fragariae TaxID=53985 RepID=A0A6A3UPP7_9STRA|nr:hypothetical protein PF003_g8496 [Phytophthora fragariae]KAE9153221.1 hypothetical protein PF006_g2617 [Phytophthora fragariae]